MTAPVTYPTGAIIESPPSGFVNMSGNSPQVALARLTSGTFVANGATPVTVSAPNVTATSIILFGLKTLGGTPAGAPFLNATPIAKTSFSVEAFAGDTSTYTYLIIG
jgi:hypothetical protein